MKTRHSWGKSQTCEKCHTDPTVYVNAESRRARFVSFWSGEYANASFVDEKIVKQVTLNQEGFGRSAHKDLSCETCHDSSDNKVCAGCHSGKAKLPRAVYLETSEFLQGSKQLLPQLRKRQMESSVWETRWTDLHDRYMQAANEFHGNPGLAQARMRSVRKAARHLNHALNAALQKAKPGTRSQE